MHVARRPSVSLHHTEVSRLTAVDGAVPVQVVVDVLVKYRDQASLEGIRSRVRLLRAVGLTPAHVRQAGGRAQWRSVSSFKVIPHV